MMKRFWLLGLTLLLIASCKNDKPQKQLCESKGLPCELLVVCTPEVQRSDLMDSVKAITEGDTPGLGAGENIFRVNNIGKNAYEGVFRVMHSQIFFEVDPKVKEPQLGVAYDVCATPQIQVSVKAPSEELMRSFLHEKKDLIQQTLMEFQVKRLAEVNTRKFSRKVSDDLMAVAGYSVKMPTDMVATKKAENFLWGGSNRGNKDINFVFYTYPWNGEDILDVDRFVEKRDSVLKTNIPGSTPQQWMATSRGLEDKPVVWPRARHIDGRVVFEVKGLWELHGGFMGGPFVSVVSVDSVAKKVVVGEGFVYNPDGQKRDLMRQLEGALRTLKKGRN